MNRISKQLVKIALHVQEGEIDDNYYFKEVDDDGYIIFKSIDGDEKSISGTDYLQNNCNLFKLMDCNYEVGNTYGEDPIMQQLSDHVGELYWDFFNNQDSWINSKFKKKIINKIVEFSDVDFTLANGWDYVTVLSFILKYFNELDEKNKKQAAWLFITQVDAEISDGDYYGNTPMINKFVNKYKSEAVKYLLQNREQLKQLFEYANSKKREYNDHIAVDKQFILDIQDIVFDMALK